MDVIKQHDTWPFLSFSFVDAAGAPLNCVGFDVRLLIRNKQNLIVTAAIGEAESGAVWVDQTQGTGEYQWKAADTEVAGLYMYEFEFTRAADGRVFTIPQNAFFSFTVQADIG